MRSTNLLASLQDCKLFHHFTEDDFYTLLHYGKLRLFFQGDVVYKRGEFAKGLFCLIVSGQVDIFTENGQLIRSMKDGEILGEIGAINPRSYRTATVKATKPTEIFEWNVDLIKGQLPELVERLTALAWKTSSNYT